MNKKIIIVILAMVALLLIGVVACSFTENEEVNINSPVVSPNDEGTGAVEEWKNETENTVEPTVTVSVSPPAWLSPSPTVTPSVEPTAQPTVSPTVSPSTQPTVSPTVQPTQKPAPTQTEYEWYISLSPADQQAYYESFASVAEFAAWYNNAKAEYDAQREIIQGGSGNNINIGDYVN